MFASPVAKAPTNAAASSTNKPAHRRATLVAHRPSLSYGWVEHAQLLQRSIGNQATLRLLAQQAPGLIAHRPGAHHEQEADRQAASSGSRDFTEIPVLPPDRTDLSRTRSPLTIAPRPAAIQPKLALGPVDDPLEHEADRIADQVMRMPDPNLSTGTARPQLSRKCAACDEEEAQTLQAKRAHVPKPAAGEAPQIVREVLRSSGKPLDAPTRAFFEPRFDHDFSNVRVHTDCRANRSARALNSLAYTVGRHVVFDDGRYSPASDRGRRLLAHELVHVVQQGGGLPLLIQRSVTECAEKVANPPDLTLIEGGGTAIHEMIRAHFASKPGAIEIIIPGGSAAPLRTEGICGKPSSLIPPQGIGGRAGGGIPDLAAQTAAGVLLVAEIKPAVIPCLIDGENQALGYINAGNAPDPPQVAWRASQGISVVSPMLESYYSPPSFALGVAQVDTLWCTPGLLAYTVYRRGKESPVFVPVPAPEPATKKQRQTLRERLPSVPQWVWASIGAVAAGLIIACFATGFCEAAGIVALVGEALGSIITGALRLAGI
jgi:hypothetical protein